jgi:diguanylate cyclase (GGDEF)-like protein/PAS domain S-box-containing protein
MMKLTENADLTARLLIQSVTDYAIYMLTPEGIVANWNPGAERAKGYTADEIVGRHFSVFYADHECTAGTPMVNLGVARDVGRFEDEGWRIRKDGTSFWAHVVIDAVHDEAGQFLGYAKITRDCTAQKQAMEAQIEQERRFRLLVQGVRDYAIYMLDPTGHVVNWNAGAQRAKGYSAAEIVGQHFSIFYTSRDREAGLPDMGLNTARRTGRFESEGERQRKDGSLFWTSVIIDAIHDDNGELIGFAKITKDITERHRYELKLLEAKELAEKHGSEMASVSRFLDSVISNIPASVIVQDVQTQKILLANQQAIRLFGGTSEMTGQTTRDCLSTGVADYLEHEMSMGISSQGIHTSEATISTANGDRTLRSRVLIGQNNDNKSDYLLLIAEDVTEELEAQAQMQHMAHHDALTGLPNRNLFHERLNNALCLARKNGSITATLCLDLDNFKNINDALGHALGDKLLCALGQRLRGVLRDQDTLARLGGDEFAIVIPELSDRHSALRTAQRIVDAVAPPFLIDGHNFLIGVSVGIALAPQDYDTAEQLLLYADMALYEAKRNGRNRYECFRPELDQAARKRRTMEADLRTALHLGQLQLYYQPIVDRLSNTISGYEALMRWPHPTKGMIMPMDFIPIAEETGLIHEIGIRAINLACQEAANWEGVQSVSVNLSPVQFKSGTLVDTVSLALADSGLAPSRLELEITESVLLENTDENILTLRALKALGVAISLDDFGTGYSSLGYLRSFPFDRIKIDKSFVRDMGESREALSIVRAITGMSNSLLIKTTAEGVETIDQMEQLTAEGCSHFQGYLFGRPIPAKERLKVLEDVSVEVSE